MDKKCTVRLAWEELLLTEGLNIPENERVIESIRLGNVMEVSLYEGRDGHNFDIKSRNHEEQVIYEDEVTEWLFDVKPLTVGNFILILRVTLIQMIEGIERKKDIVLERNVVTEAVVPEALPRFETAEKGLIPPSAISEEDLLKNLESFSKSKQVDNSNGYRELSEDGDSSIQPRDSNSAKPSRPSIFAPKPCPPPASPSPNKPSSPQAPQVKSTTFGKILPYAASLALLVVVGALFFPRFGSQYSNEYEASSPNEVIVDGAPSKSEREGAILVALSLKSTTPTGESIHEVLLFTIAPLKLDSLTLLDPGNFSLEVFPAADTLNLSLGKIPELTVREIQDSIQKVSSKPAVVGNLVLERNQLQTHPENRIINTQPQRLDSASLKKLQVRPRNLREN